MSIASESSICLLSFFIDVLMYLRGQIPNMCLSDTAADTDDGLVSQSRGKLKSPLILPLPLSYETQSDWVSSGWLWSKNFKSQDRPSIGKTCNRLNLDGRVAGVDKLVIFLAKRDGIDKLVKTFQYVSKLVRWQVEATHPDVAQRFKQWEVASGLGRKAFRTGRFLTGFNALRRGPGSTPTFKILAVLANAGEMVYFFFDHFLWLSRIGTLDAKLAGRMSFISAFGESFGYIFFIIADFIIIKEGLEEERRLLTSSKEDTSKDATESVRKIRADRVMRLMAVAANAADFIIALADIEPNPFCNHAVTLGVSGLVSAWAGWYRNWPS
ncbi:hypothetical protein NC653_008890 [Populus alba x Populus x berolinensis]|uniref:Peroxisomal membrane protein 11B n=1 Tax=Populus alba x Populus x berolinensis TaxID=444605 RepID=A0AAD6R7W1_9ROSI|nr:hypothetical protein NC653_008890 [Populus alba x Populus x berolinensis]